MLLVTPPAKLERALPTEFLDAASPGPDASAVVMPISTRRRRVGERLAALYLGLVMPAVGLFLLAVWLVIMLSAVGIIPPE